MGLIVHEIEALRSSNPDLHRALKKIVRAVNTLSKRVAVDPSKALPAPAKITAVDVSAADGIFEGQIIDATASANTRTLAYFLEYDTVATFQTPKAVYLGPVRNFRLALGNLTLFFRAYSQYPGSNPSPPTAFGGATPQSVIGGGSNGPAQKPSSGTGTAANPTKQATGGAGFGRFDRDPQPRRSGGNRRAAIEW